MYDEKISDVEVSDEIGKFVESYSSFNRIINKIQRQYLSLKETYSLQSDELQKVNESLQSAMTENRVVSEFFDSILNSLTSGVIAVDHNQKVTLINPAAIEILGLENDFIESHRSKYEEIVRAEENTEFSAVEAVRTGRIFENVEKKVKTSFGSNLTLSVSTSLLKNRSGETIGAVELFFDITKIKRLEDQLSQMKVLASLGEMAASIAHEVRNPLVGIGGFASLLARDLKGDPAKWKMARKIVEGVDNINNTVQTLLDFARREKVNKATVDLNAYLNIILDNFADQAGYTGGTINRAFSSENNIFVDIDRQLFKQAIYNLIKNGLEASRVNPWVCVMTGTLSRERAQTVYADRLELSATDKLVQIVIEDNGPGIAEKNLTRIFSPFFSTKENGTGLGLPIAWKIIKAHGGDLTAESKNNNGTRFAIVLPAKKSINGEKVC